MTIGVEAFANAVAGHSTKRAKFRRSAALRSYSCALGTPRGAPDATAGIERAMISARVVAALEPARARSGMSPCRTRCARLLDGSRVSRTRRDEGRAGPVR